MEGPTEQSVAKMLAEKVDKKVNELNHFTLDYIEPDANVVTFLLNEIARLELMVDNMNERLLLADI